MFLTRSVVLYIVTCPFISHWLVALAKWQKNECRRSVCVHWVSRRLSVAWRAGARNDWQFEDKHFSYTYLMMVARWYGETGTLFNDREIYRKHLTWSTLYRLHDKCYIILLVLWLLIIVVVVVVVVVVVGRSIVCSRKKNKTNTCMQLKSKIFCMYRTFKTLALHVGLRWPKQWRYSIPL